jgi:transposase
MTDLREAEAKELIAKAPSCTSNFRYLENPELTPLLKTLIEQSASPLKAVECDFAADSSGFATSTYNRWFDMKYGKERTSQAYVKVHVMCGVKTHIVTAVECSPKETGDSPEFIPMLNKTAETFKISEVSADKAYSARANIHAVHALGATPYIAFKGNAVGVSKTMKYDSLWHRMLYFYQFNRDAFLAEYHKRSNVESVFSMMKAKFGTAVRTKTPTAQVNEVLCKVLCHNICCLIQSIFELGIEPMFWTSEPKNPPALVEAVGSAFGAEMAVAPIVEAK